MKLIIFILIVLIIAALLIRIILRSVNQHSPLLMQLHAALLIRIILRSVNQHSPLLMQLHAAGIRTGDAERILSSGEYWQRQKTLLTEREVSFMKGLFRIVDMKRWYLCPQVRVADIVQLNGNIRPRSRQWWQLFRMVSQWHVDVVIVERRSFSIVAAVELDDASHLRPERRRRDILLEEVLRQAGIPLLRSHDARKLLDLCANTDLRHNSQVADFKKL
ncbi:DUF2726 domain-containing protein [Escherichia coli]|uniref:DUF2726 domain-containing protein n=1 Tax=Escherichia coli TaxID=562 RepID=UPI00098C6E5B|nr:DUF2726 domain-containing protein [Escherichia coli]